MKIKSIKFSVGFLTGFESANEATAAAPAPATAAIKIIRRRRQTCRNPCRGGEKSLSEFLFFLFFLFVSNFERNPETLQFLLFPCVTKLLSEKKIPEGTATLETRRPVTKSRNNNSLYVLGNEKACKNVQLIKSSLTFLLQKFRPCLKSDLRSWKETEEIRETDISTSWKLIIKSCTKTSKGTHDCKTDKKVMPDDIIGFSVGSQH